jgi:type II secretory pathway component PulK
LRRRGVALVAVLLIAATLAVAAASSALLTDLHLRLVRNRADALTAESAALAGAAVAEALLRSSLASTGAVPASIALPSHAALPYRVVGYERVPGSGVRIRVEGSGRAGGRAEVVLELRLAGSDATFRIHR